MKTLAVGEFKARFADALQMVRQGENVGVTYGRKGKLVAVLVPPESVSASGGVKLGLLTGQATFKVHPGFEMNDEEFLSS